MISVWGMNNPRFSLSKNPFLGSPMFAPAPVPRRDGALHHLLVDRQRAGGGGIEFEAADDTPVDLAQRARAEALLLRRIPGDRNQRAARDLQVDAEALE